MEYIDVLNEYGVKTGEVESRDNIHLKGLWHRGVIAIIVNNNNEILMQQRSETRKKFPGLWDLSLAAHVRTNEDSLKTLVREFNEEIGVRLSNNIKTKDCRYITSFQNEHCYYVDEIKYTEKFLYDFFIIYKDVPVEDFSFNDGEVQDVKWMKYFDVVELKNKGLTHPRTEWIEIIKKYLSMF